MPVHVPLWFAVTNVAPMLPALALIVIKLVVPSEAIPLDTSEKTRNDVPVPVKEDTFNF